MADEFRWPVRVYWEDTDAGGVVYHGAYVRFLERARSEWLRSRGVAQSRLAAEHGLVFAVTGMTLRFLEPARLDDELLASCRPGAPAGARIAFSQALVRAGDNALLVEATVAAACLDAASFRPRRIPPSLLAELNR